MKSTVVRLVIWMSIVMVTFFSFFLAERDHQLDDSVNKDSSFLVALKQECTGICLSSNCFGPVATKLARAYPDKSNRTAWILPKKIVPPEEKAMDDYAPKGIILVKNFKAASSTAAGVALRLAFRYGPTHSRSHRKKLLPPKRKLAQVTWHHAKAHFYVNRHPQKSLMFTSVRDPASRAISRIFYTHVSQKGGPSTDDNILHKLNSDHIQYGSVSYRGGGFQVRFLSTQHQLNISWHPKTPELVIRPEQVQRNVQEIIHEYDFIMVAERMDESVVAFALILGLPMEAVLVQDAKVGGSFSWVYWVGREGQERVHRCTRSVKSFRSARVQQHLESKEWYAKNYGDYLLHEAANKSLDQTIERLGRSVHFEPALREYQRLKQKARLMCANQTIGQCSANGTAQRDLANQNCYGDDSGCGYACIEAMLEYEKGSGTNND